MTHQAGTALLACAACAGLAGPARATPTETTLYGAQCTPNASVLLASLIQPTPGSLIGTSFAGGLLNIGSVFRLMRNRIVSRLWPESVLYSFGSHTDPPPASDPASPMAGLLPGPGGVFYGTGYYSNDPGCGGNGCGAIYQLTPSPHSAAPWQEQVLYDFLGMPDGQNPVGNLVADASGALYGVTTNGGATGAGAVFRLTPPATAGHPWKPTILYSFQNGPDGGFPAAGLLIDANGVLYGTTADSGQLGAGTIFQLAPRGKGNAWQETVLYTFGISGAPDDGDQPMASLIADTSGALYGTTIFGGTAGRGTVFRLKPPKSGKHHWRETTLYSFTNTGDGALPGAAVLLKSKSLYGTTEGTGATGSYGTVFQLTPAPGTSPWTETTLYSFTGGADGKYPLAALISDGTNFYGTTESGGPKGCGVVFQVTP